MTAATRPGAALGERLQRAHDLLDRLAGLVAYSDDLDLAHAPGRPAGDPVAYAHARPREGIGSRATTRHASSRTSHRLDGDVLPALLRTEESTAQATRLLGSMWPLAYAWDPGPLVRWGDRPRQLQSATALLTGMGLLARVLADLAPAAERMTERQAQAAADACAQIERSWAGWPEDMREAPAGWPGHDAPRCRRAGCEGPDGQPRLMAASRGKVCPACRQRDSRARRSRGVPAGHSRVVAEACDGAVRSP